MPFGLKPRCHKCQTDVSDIWHRINEGNTVCNECFLGRMVTASMKTEPTVKALEKASSPEIKCPDEDTCNEIVEIDEIITDEPTDDAKARIDLGPGTRSGNTTSSVRGGKAGSKKARGRSKKIGNITKTTVGKGRGRRAVFKKQVLTSLKTFILVKAVIYKLFISYSYH